MKRWIFRQIIKTLVQSISFWNLVSLFRNGIICFDSAWTGECRLTLRRWPTLQCDCNCSCLYHDFLFCDAHNNGGVRQLTCSSYSYSPRHSFSSYKQHEILTSSSCLISFTSLRASGERGWDRLDCLPSAFYNGPSWSRRWFRDLFSSFGWCK